MRSSVLHLPNFISFLLEYSNVCLAPNLKSYNSYFKWRAIDDMTILCLGSSARSNWFGLVIPILPNHITSWQPVVIMNTEQVYTYVDKFWDSSIIPTLSKYIEIPNQSPGKTQCCTESLHNILIWVNVKPLIRNGRSLVIPIRLSLYWRIG